MSKNEWTLFNGIIPQCGYYEIKINNVELKNVVVEAINTKDDDTNEKLNGFVISRMSEEDYDRWSGCWITKAFYLFIDPKIITHFRDSLSYDVYRATNDDEVQKFYQLISELKPEKTPKPHPKTPTDKFNAKNTPLGVLTDYAFGGDKKAALEYIKTL
jgi:hypothetical protein